MSVGITIRPGQKEVSQRKLEMYDKYCQVIQWGRANPVNFCSRFMGIELLDYQSYMIENTWRSDFALWLACRNAGKTTILAVYTMLRSLLIPMHTTYIIGVTGAQSREMFLKIEKIAKKEIESFVGTTDVFYDEVFRGNSTGDGFTHNPESFTVKLMNNSQIFTINSDPDNMRGRRASMVVIDECGYVNQSVIISVENYANQSENFKLGGDINIALEPKGFPRQLLYASSASDTNSDFYKKFKLFSQRMMMGDKKYFACNIDIEQVLSARYKGEEYPPLLSKDKVDRAMADNKEKALRELYNKFSADSFDGQILTRRDLMQCTVNRPPLLFNDTGNRLFMMSWDSARLNDNSVIAIAELVLDKEKGWCMNLVNVVSLVDIKTKKKTPMRIPEQIKVFQDLLLKYNGNEYGKLDYENIKAIVCDSGAGGQMVGGICDNLLPGFQGKDGKYHKGLIDKAHKANETAKNTYPDAVDIIKLVDPKGNRSLIFDSIEKMVKLGVVTFPADWDGKDELITINDDGTEDRYSLSPDEKISLAQIELAKTEIITMCKYVTNGNVVYNYPPEKRNTMHDDRLFAIALLTFYLEQLRRGQIVNKPKEAPTTTIFQFRQPQINKRGLN